MGRLDFLYRMELPHRAVSVYIYLSDRANKDGECWPAIPTIAAELKLSQSTVRRALRDLRKAGLLDKRRQKQPALQNSMIATEQKTHLPPRDNYIHSVAGGTCHDGR